MTRIRALRSRVPVTWQARFWSRAAGAIPSLRITIAEGRRRENPSAEEPLCRCGDRLKA
jgi:hypothetical protein